MQKANNLAFPAKHFSAAYIPLGIRFELEKDQSQMGQLSIRAILGTKKVRGKVNPMTEKGHKRKGQIQPVGIRHGALQMVLANEEAILGKIDDKLGQKNVKP